GPGRPHAAEVHAREPVGGRDLERGDAAAGRRVRRQPVQRTTRSATRPAASGRPNAAERSAMASSRSRWSTTESTRSAKTDGESWSPRSTDAPPARCTARALASWWWPVAYGYGTRRAGTPQAVTSAMVVAPARAT